MSLHVIDPAEAASIPVRQQVHAFLSPVWKVSYTTAKKRRECRLIACATQSAVLTMCKRVLGADGCTDFVAGRYLGAEHPEPAPRRAT